MTQQKIGTVFEHQSVYPCSAEDLYAWHSREGALERLLPPWEKWRVLDKDGGIEPGGWVIVRMYAGPIPYLLTARHTRTRPGVMFEDIQERGPFRSWTHRHLFENTEYGAILRDHVEYTLPGHDFLPSTVKNYVDKRLRKLFRHRETVLRADLDLHRRSGSERLRILMSGASGVLGRDLLPLLTTGGHEVWRLVRRRPDPAKKEIHWDPEKRILNAADLPELDGVIHLAGEYLGLSKWSDEKKRRVIESRVDGTELLAITLAAMPRPPKTFLSASAVGYYGGSDSKEINECTPPGNTFISKVCQRWEASAEPARQRGIRTVFLRLGVGLTPQGGALKRILAGSPFGIFRRFGSGHQYISWISSDDMISAIVHVLTCESLEGPLNIGAPEAVTNSQFMETLAHVTGRPLLCAVPARLLQLLYGQMASEILLSGCRVSTRKLQNSGFKFRHPTLEAALRALLGKI